MSTPNYPIARTVAPKIREYLSTYYQSAEFNYLLIPEVEVIEAMIEVAFWTSLRREEQSPPRISLCYINPEQCSSVTLKLKKPLPLTPRALTRIAPGIERPGIHLGVWHVDGALCAWGAVRSLPQYSFVIETVAPGHLAIKCRLNEQSAKFVNIAVLEGENVKYLNHKLQRTAEHVSILNSLLGSGTVSSTTTDLSNALVQLSLSMRETKKGGTLLIVPKNNDTWRTSIAHPLSYEITPPYRELSEAYLVKSEQGHEARWKEKVSRAVDAVAGFTAIDGATLINEDYEVLAFGAKIIRREGAKLLEYVTVVEPIVDAVHTVIPIGQLGGTRHISAALFAYDQLGSVAMVASQDGPFTIFLWSEEQNILFAQRIDTLLI